MADVKVQLTEIQASIVREALEVHADALERALETEQDPSLRLSIGRELQMVRDLRTELGALHG